MADNRRCHCNSGSYARYSYRRWLYAKKEWQHIPQGGLEMRSVFAKIEMLKNWRTVIYDSEYFLV